MTALLLAILCFFYWVALTVVLILSLITLVFPFAYLFHSIFTLIRRPTRV